MLYGVLDYSTSGSTLIDPIVLQDQQEKAIAAATLAAQQAAASTAVAQQGTSDWKLAMLAGVVGLGLWYWEKHRHGKVST